MRARTQSITKMENADVRERRCALLLGSLPCSLLLLNADSETAETPQCLEVCASAHESFICGALLL